MKTVHLLLSRFERLNPELYGCAPPAILTHEENRETIRPWQKRKKKSNRVSAAFQAIRDAAEAWGKR